MAKFMRAVTAALIAFPNAAYAEARCVLQTQWENDVFAQGKDTTDRWYTHGTRITRGCHGTGDALDTRLRRVLLGEWATPASGSEVVPYSTFFGQHLYTPGDIRIAAAQPDDRPWAGWLYIGRAYQGARAAERLGQEVAVHRVAEVSVGVIGPSAMAGEVQREFHRLINSARPAGWHNQLRDEPALNLRWRETVKFGNHRADALVHWGFNVGTVQNFGNFGTTLRYGHNLGDFGVSLVSPSVSDPKLWVQNSLSAASRGESSFYVSAGLDARAIAHNIFLDGNNFRSGPSVRKRWLVADGIVGITWTRFPYSLSYLHAWRSSELRGARDWQRFGSIIASFAFW